LHGRPNELFSLIVIVVLLEENVSLRDDAFAKVRPLGGGISVVGGAKDDRHLGGSGIEISLTICLAPRLPPAFLRSLRVQAAGRAIMSFAAAAIAVDW
jgi:hypothetical protein